MSPNVGNFVHDLVEMAKAMETLPVVEADLSRAKRMIDELSQTVQDRELSIINYKQQIDELNNKVRSLEVERDDASFRVLEAEDQAHTALSMARSAAASLEAVITKLDPPKPQPEPVKEPEASKELWPEASDDQPKVPEAVHSISEAGQSESSPTVSSVDTQLQTVSSTVEQLGSASPETSKPAVPFYNKRYMDVEGYISRHDWLAGGGTEEDYDWRPSPGTEEFHRSRSY